MKISRQGANMAMNNWDFHLGVLCALTRSHRGKASPETIAFWITATINTDLVYRKCPKNSSPSLKALLFVRWSFTGAYSSCLRSLDSRLSSTVDRYPHNKLKMLPNRILQERFDENPPLRFPDSSADSSVLSI